MNNQLNAKQNFSCFCDICENDFIAPKHTQIIPPSVVPLTQDKDMSMLLRRLQPPNKLTRSVRVQIQETCVFSENEPKFVAYCEKGERNIKFTPKMTLQQIRQFMIKIEDRQPKESILLKFIDSIPIQIQCLDNTQVMGDNEFLILMTKRRIDPIWNTVLYIQTMITAKNFTLYHVDFNYEVESERLQFFRAKTEILVLSGEISRAASDYVSIDSEEQYEDSLSVEDYCRYVTYKMVHYVDIFGGARINSAKFSFFGKLFVTVEKMDLVEITRKLLFDSENLLKKKKIENEDDQLYQRLLELNLTEEREHAIKVYSEILQMENKFIDSSHLMKNKLTVTGFDQKSHNSEIQQHIQMVMQSTDPVNTLRRLLTQLKKREEKLYTILNHKQAAHP